MYNLWTNSLQVYNLPVYNLPLYNLPVYNLPVYNLLQLERVKWLVGHFTSVLLLTRVKYTYNAQLYNLQV
jgi:hypothetical protein